MMGCLVSSAKVQLSGVRWPHGAARHIVLVEEQEGCVGPSKRTDKNGDDVS